MLLALPGLVAAIGLCIWGILSEPFVGLLGMLVFIVAQPEQVFLIVGTLHVEKIFGAAILIMTLVRGNKLHLSPVGGWLLAFYGAMIASIPFAIWGSNSLAGVEDFGKTLLLAFLVISLVTTRQRLKIFLIVYVILLAYLAVSGLSAYFSGQVYIGTIDRLVGTTSDSNAPDTLATTMVITLPLLAAFLVRGNKFRTRLFFGGLAALCVWALLLTGTRTAFYALIVVLLIYALRSPRRARVLPALLIVGFTLWVSLPQEFKARYESGMTAAGRDADEAYQLRLMSWQGGWHMFLHNPLTGIGVDDYTVANGMQYWPAPHKIYLNAHSLFFQLIGELGLCGLVSFGGLITTLSRLNTRLQRELVARGEETWLIAYPRCANYVIFALLFIGYGGHVAYRSTWYLLAGLSGALALILERERAAAASAPSAESPAALAPAAEFAPN